MKSDSIHIHSVVQEKYQTVFSSMADGLCERYYAREDIAQGFPWFVEFTDNTEFIRRYIKDPDFFLHNKALRNTFETGDLLKAFFLLCFKDDEFVFRMWSRHKHTKILD